MKCTILHDLPGRLRVHLCCGRMTLSQADVLEYYLRAQDGVQEVRVYDRTQDAVVLYEAERFDAFDAMLKRRGVRIPIRHLNNSAGLMNFDRHYEMVRSGIVTYGLYPSDEVDAGLLPLTPAMRLLSRVSYVKPLSPGREISYGGTFVTSRPTVVATVPVGYADGYRRSLSGRFYVLVRGQRAPILGRVCMDQMMVDVTDIPGVQAGDTVTLIGTDGDETISMEDIAAAAGSFNYEFACGISRRVPRVYLRGGKAVHTVHYLTDIFQEEPHGT